MQEFYLIDTFGQNTQNQTHLENRPCPICGSNHYTILREENNLQFFTDSASESKRRNIRDCQCRNCYAIYRNPCFTTTGFEVLFREAGYSYGAAELRPQEKLNWLQKHELLNGAVLDVGCYDGSFLNCLPNSLIRMGVDIDKPAIKRGLANNASLLLEHGRFETFIPTKAPTLITMFHVLEHVSNPIAVLQRLYSVSTEDANLVIEVPILEKGITNDIGGFLTLQHLTHFSKRSLALALEVSGWNIIETEEMESYNGYLVLAKKAISKTEIIGSIEDLLCAKSMLVSWLKAQMNVEFKIKTFVIGGGYRYLGCRNAH